MDNIRRHPRSNSQEFRSRNNSRGNSRYNSRENSRERASSRERERRPPEIRNINIEDSPAKRNRERKPLRQYDENQSRFVKYYFVMYLLVIWEQNNVYNAK